MFGLFSKEPELVQPINPEDKVIPLNAADDTDVLRSVVVVLSYRFDDCLDPVKLKNTFEELLDRPGWRKIGARLRQNVSKIEVVGGGLIVDLSRIRQKDDLNITFQQSLA